MDWQEVSGNWVLIPPRPTAIIHFLGGAFVATAPQLTYRWLLEQIANQGYIIIATPFLNGLDHLDMARQVLHQFENGIERLYHTGQIKKSYLPIYGIGHSMGCKLHLLINSLFTVKRQGNIFISFNNYTASEAIPIVEQINPIINVEFTPSPPQTRKIIQENYPTPRNLLIKFKDDTIDQSIPLNKVLENLFPGMITLKILPGNHQTPLGQDVSWPIGQVFSPLDAIGQWFKQEVYRELNQLKQTILFWLNPRI